MFATPLSPTYFAQHIIHLHNPTQPLIAKYTSAPLPAHNPLPQLSLSLLTSDIYFTRTSRYFQRLVATPVSPYTHRATLLVNSSHEPVEQWSAALASSPVLASSRSLHNWRRQSSNWCNYGLAARDCCRRLKYAKRWWPYIVVADLGPDV